MNKELLEKLATAQNAMYEVRKAVCSMPALTTEKYASDFTVELPDGIQCLNDDRWEQDVAALLKGFDIYTRGQYFRLK